MPRFHRLAIILFCVTLGACGTSEPAADHTEATNDVIGQGLVQIKPLSQLGSSAPLATFGLPVLGNTNLVFAASKCEGAAGSVLPPLAFQQCTASMILGPLRALENATGSTGGRTVALRGLAQFWVQQKKDNLCWAAAFETVRGYLHLKHIPHEDMPGIASQECPKLFDQPKGAELFQIGFVITKIISVYDNGKLTFHACTDERCIIQSLERGRPVMILKSSHALLIQAVEIAAGTSDMIRRYRILDPAGDGNLEIRDPLEICTADAIIAF